MRSFNVIGAIVYEKLLSMRSYNEIGAIMY
jgi:hypothetical protein